MLPVHKALKFSTVLGTTFPNKPISIIPSGMLSISIKNDTVCVIYSSANLALTINKVTNRASIVLFIL